MKRGVVILNGAVSTVVAKRAAGVDAWDTPSVTDVSNQVVVQGTLAQTASSTSVTPPASCWWRT